MADKYGLKKWRRAVAGLELIHLAIPRYTKIQGREYSEADTEVDECIKLAIELIHELIKDVEKLSDEFGLDVE